MVCSISHRTRAVAIVTEPYKLQNIFTLNSGLRISKKYATDSTGVTEMCPIFQHVHDQFIQAEEVNMQGSELNKELTETEILDVLQEYSPNQDPSILPR